MTEVTRDEAVLSVVNHERDECAAWASGIEPERGHSDAFKDGWLAARAEAARVIKSRKDDSWACEQITDAIRTALAGEAKAETPWSATGEPWETYLDRQREKYAALEAENARLGHERDAWRSSSTRLAAERDGLREERDTAVTQRDEFQRRMLEAEKQLRSYQESYEIVAKERDALAAKVKDVAAARDRAESEVNALLQTDHALGKAVAIYSAIRAAAKE